MPLSFKIVTSFTISTQNWILPLHYLNQIAYLLQVCFVGYLICCNICDSQAHSRRTDGDKEVSQGPEISAESVIMVPLENLLHNQNTCVCRQLWKANMYYGTGFDSRQTLDFMKWLMQRVLVKYLCYVTPSTRPDREWDANTDLKNRHFFTCKQLCLCCRETAAAHEIFV